MLLVVTVGVPSIVKIAFSVADSLPGDEASASNLTTMSQSLVGAIAPEHVVATTAKSLESAPR